MKDHLCGVSLDDTSQCKNNDVCPSSCGLCSNSDFNLDHSCYGFKVYVNQFCGVLLDDASQCNDNNKCPLGFSFWFLFWLSL